MTENTNTETAAEAIADTGNSTEETSPMMGDAEQEQTTDANEFGDADRAKLTEVVKKERAAAKAQAARAEQAEKRLAELEASELRRTVAEEKGLTPAQAEFLTGDDAEEMAAAADALLAAFPGRPDALRRTREATLRTGATGVTHPGPSVTEVADRVLD